MCVWWGGGGGEGVRVYFSTRARGSVGTQGEVNGAVREVIGECLKGKDGEVEGGCKINKSLVNKKNTIGVSTSAKCEQTLISMSPSMELKKEGMKQNATMVL